MLGTKYPNYRYPLHGLLNTATLAAEARLRGHNNMIQANVAFWNFSEDGYGEIQALII